VKLPHTAGGIRAAEFDHPLHLAVLAEQNGIGDLLAAAGPVLTAIEVLADPAFVGVLAFPTPAVDRRHAQVVRHLQRLPQSPADSAHQPGRRRIRPPEGGDDRGQPRPPLLQFPGERTGYRDWLTGTPHEQRPFDDNLPDGDGRPAHKPAPPQRRQPPRHTGAVSRFKLRLGRNADPAGQHIENAVIGVGQALAGHDDYCSVLSADLSSELASVAAGFFFRLDRRGRERDRLRTGAGEPQFGIGDDPQPIDWWELRNSGFTAARYEEPLRDDAWKLTGRPFLVLCRGDDRVPVFRQHHPTETLYRQHFARIAAYCHLIQRSTGYKSPYGVILFGTTYKGVALRNSPSAQAAFHQGLAEARQTVRQARRGDDPRPPEPERCVRCPVGRPVLRIEGVTDTVCEGRVLQAGCLYGPENKLYHSACGDRFRWVPPHERMHELRLSLHPK